MSVIILPSDQAGVLITIRSTKPTPGLLTIEGLTGEAASVLVTSINLTARVAQQSLPTIGGPEYIYVFGDMLQDISVGLVVYAKPCPGQPGGSSFMTAWRFYSQNRLTPGKVDTVTLNFGGLSLRGLVIGFQVSAEAEAGSAVIRGTLLLKGWAPTENQPSAEDAASYGPGVAP